MIDFLKKLFATPPHPENKGVVVAEIRGTDYIAGVNSPVAYKEVLTNGDWRQFAWSQVKQWNWKNGKYHDNLGCTGNAFCTDLETQYFQKTGQKIQISRRWVNKMSGCNQGQYKGLGNTVVAPVDWVRKNGFVLEEDYPTPDSWTVDEYYAPIPEPLNSELLAKARENKVKYKLAKSMDDDCLKYEYLVITDPNIDKHLKHAPLLSTIPGHQTCTIASPTQLSIYRDSYEPWDKTYPSSSFLTLLKVVIEPTVIEAGFVKFTDSPEVWFMAKMDSMERLEKFKHFTFDGDYVVKEGITTLPFKKPF